MRAREKRRGSGRHSERKVGTEETRTGLSALMKVETRDVIEAVRFLSVDYRRNHARYSPMIATRISAYMRHDGTPFDGAAMESRPKR